MRRSLLLLALLLTGCHASPAPSVTPAHSQTSRSLPLRPAFANPSAVAQQPPPVNSPAPAPQTAEEPQALATDFDSLIGHWEEKRNQEQTIDIDRSWRVIFYGGKLEAIGASLEYEGRLQFGNDPIPGTATGTLYLTDRSRKLVQEGLQRAIADASERDPSQGPSFAANAERALVEAEKPLAMKVAIDRRNGDLITQIGPDVARFTRMTP